MPRHLWILVGAVALVACGDPGGEPGAVDRAATPTTGAVEALTASTTTTSATTPAPASGPDAPASAVTTPRPDWLGTRVLPLRPDGLGEIRPTPPELADRRFATVDVLPPPRTDEFRPTVTTVPADVAARSTWSEACPVTLDDLRYVTVPFWGFDQQLHTGELLLHADAVDPVLAGFAGLFERRFPIEEMRITRPDELDAPPTGDGNNTGAFVCRPSVGSTSWSQHAYGRAVDVNPFHNPYVRGDVVIPELASTYADRAHVRPGMLTADDVAGFETAGWGWGGLWSASKDHMHLSADGR